MLLLLFCTDADKLRRHGLDELVQADPCDFDHGEYYRELQSLTLDYRLNHDHSVVVSHVSLPPILPHIPFVVLTYPYPAPSTPKPRSKLKCMFNIAGLVQHRPAKHLGRVLQSVRSARLLPPSDLLV